MTEFSDMETRTKAVKAEIDTIIEVVGALRKQRALDVVKREEQGPIKAQSAAKGLNRPVAVWDAGRRKHQQQPYSMIEPKPCNASGSKPQTLAKPPQRQYPSWLWFSIAVVTETAIRSMSAAYKFAA